MPTKTGGVRSVWIKDAMELGLLPSVTNVLGVISKPGLDDWKLTQVALAASRNQRTADESEEYYAKRLVELSKKPVEEAADLGTKIHDALEKSFEGEPVADDLRVYVDPVMVWLQETGIAVTDREIVVANTADGYAGRVDVLFRYGKAGIGVLDYKTRKTQVGKKVTPYDGQAAQLAAYAAAFYGEEHLDRVLIANVYISTTEPGRMDVIKHDKPREHFGFFRTCCAAWRYIKGYDPRTP